jgi:integrase
VEQTYLPYARANKKSSHLDVSYCKDFVSHFGEHRLEEITPLSIERYKQYLIAKPTYRPGARTASSVNKHIHMLSRVLSYAMDSGMLVENPARKVRKLRESQNRTRVLSHEEEKRLLSTLERRQRAHLQPLVRLALLTGMRRGELLRMRWDTHVDFARGEVYATDTKSGKDRAIPMSEDCRHLLLELKESATVGDYLFTYAGKPITDSLTAWAEAVSDAELEDFHFHDLWHTFATRLGDAGASVFDIAALLGHSSISMTARYTHATEAGKQRAIAALDARRGQVLVTNAFGAKSDKRLTG